MASRKSTPPRKSAGKPLQPRAMKRIKGGSSTTLVPAVQKTSQGVGVLLPAVQSALPAVQ